MSTGHWNVVTTHAQLLMVTNRRLLCWRYWLASTNERLNDDRHNSINVSWSYIVEALCWSVCFITDNDGINYRIKRASLLCLADGGDIYYRIKRALRLCLWQYLSDSDDIYYGINRVVRLYLWQYLTDDNNNYYRVKRALRQYLWQYLTNGDDICYRVKRALRQYLWQYLTDGDDICYRVKRALRLYMAATDTNYSGVSGVTRCFVYVKRIPTDTVDDNVTVDQPRKRARLSAVNSSTTDNLSPEHDFRALFCPHKVKSVNFLLPRQEAHLVTVTDIGRCHDVVFTGVTCSVIIRWRDDVADSVPVYRSCGHITLCARDFVNQQVCWLLNTSSVLSGQWTFLIEVFIYALSVCWLTGFVYMVVGGSVVMPCCMSGPVTTCMGDCLWTGKPSQYVTIQPGPLSLLPSVQQ